MNWPDLIKDLLYAEHIYNKKDPDDFNFDKNKTHEIPFSRRTQLLHDYPAIAARHFDRRFKKLLKYLMSNEVLLGGKIIDFWWRTEFQMRGSPHIHMLLWVDISYDFNSPEGIALIDTVISCKKISDDSEIEELIKKCQTHKCTHTCFKKNKKACRFGYPFEESAQTIILAEEEIRKNNGKFVKLKRNKSESNINNYCLKILFLWGANMDIQPIGSAFGIAFYVAKYVAKEEPYAVQKHLQEAMKAITEASSIDFVQKLRNASNLLMKSRERSAQEGSYVICGLPLRGSSRTTVFINTKSAEQRTR